MPARRASKFCAKRRAVTPEVFSQSLISRGIPGFCEPWSEFCPKGGGGGVHDQSYRLVTQPKSPESGRKTLSEPITWCQALGTKYFF